MNWWRKTDSPIYKTDFYILDNIKKTLISSNPPVIDRFQYFERVI